MEYLSPSKRGGHGFVKDKHPQEEQGVPGPFELDFREKVLAFVKILLIGWERLGTSRSPNLKGNNEEKYSKLAENSLPAQRNIFQPF